MPAPSVHWKPIEPLPELNGELTTRLAGVDALKSAWEELQETLSPGEIEAALKRRLRRHAIETGIIERLYEMSWGVTEALVAEGLTSEVAMAGGEVTDSTLAIITDQFEGLSYLVDWVRADQDLSVHFVRSLHQLIVRHQEHHEGRDQFGRTVSIALSPGQWKEQGNRITRQDGAAIEFCPPMLVDDQMERLVELYKQTEGAHPVIRAAWLHHRFIQIHPFADGNGRVARALTLLSLQRGHYAPIVVDRLQRTTYIESLDAANDGDLRPLVRFFAHLEEKALRAEIQTPALHAQPSGAIAVARAYATRLKAREVSDWALKAARGAELADAVHQRLVDYLGKTSVELEQVYREIDSRASGSLDSAKPPAQKAAYWHGQLVHAANLADFFTNLTNGSWWVRLHLRARGFLLRFIVAVQKVGQGETGVMAMTVFGEVLNAGSPAEGGSSLLFRVFDRPNNVPDSITFVYTDDVETRWPEVEQLIETSLSSAISAFSEQLA
ncbi:Fic family protein [Actinocrinis puniceicyclus]|uniref:Fic family protein n=1 Tax=Actinocrinis puniceicyclus TaxID=977794 RepID=A0A8J8BBP5_9ACTN|nr:Fic family protein [Actinocrinis puniceicyclus]MBS2962680.1 Fic family protein [Actinocrinis puniceicyclus]